MAKPKLRPKHHLDDFRGHPHSSQCPQWLIYHHSQKLFIHYQQQAHEGDLERERDQLSLQWSTQYTQG